MSALRISPDLSLPLDVVTDTIGVIAVKGSGKSYTFMVMAEEMVRSGAPVVIVDVVGVCWGLRVSADGKGEGLPVIVLGGEHGDLPLDPNAGRVLAEFAASERRSIVLDVSAFDTKADQIRFVTAFMSRLYEVNREPLHVMIDEADEFAPQKPFGEETRLVRAMEILVRRGRARGLGITMVTQRPAVLNKNVLTMCGTLIIGRTVAPQDRKAIGEWVDANGTDEQKKTLYASLATLPTSDKWVWTPLTGIFKRVRIRTRETFDSSATPKLGAVRLVPRKLAPVDLDALKTRIAATIEKAEADDPKKLRARIVDLTRELAKQQPATRVERVEVEKIVRDEELVSLLGQVHADVRRIEDQLAAATLRAHMPPAPKTSEGQPARAPMVVARSNGVDLASSRTAPPRNAASSRTTNGTSAPSRSPTRSEGSDSTLGAGERKILTALAQHPDGLTRTQIALLTGYSSSGGRFANLLGALRSGDCLLGEGEGPLRITKKGEEVLGPYDVLPTGRDLFDYWKHRVGKTEGAVLDELRSVHPRALDRIALANRIGKAADGGRYNNVLGYLRTLNLIAGKGEIRLSEELVG